MKKKSKNSKRKSQNSPRSNKSNLMLEAAREAACANVEDVWDRLLWVTESNGAEAVLSAMQALARLGDYDNVMTFIDVLYGIHDCDVPPEIEFCHSIPSLHKPFIDEFLSESKAYLLRLQNAALELDDLSY